MSRTSKQEKGSRSKIPLGRGPKGVSSAISSRHSFGSTEKILRRNRKTWTRLANKRRRSADKKEIEK